MARAASGGEAGAEADETDGAFERDTQPPSEVRIRLPQLRQRGFDFRDYRIQIVFFAQADTPTRIIGRSAAGLQRLGAVNLRGVAPRIIWVACPTSQR